jgi:hypothetical protein
VIGRVASSLGVSQSLVNNASRGRGNFSRGCGCHNPQGGGNGGGHE